MTKILLYDTEVSRVVAEGYGNKWDFKVVKIVRHQTLMCYAYKWLGEKTIHFRSFHGYPSYKDFIQSLADIKDQADITIAHNQPFDDKMSNRFFIKDDIAPPSPYLMIDTLQVARRNFKFQGNSLNELSEFLEIGKKEDITYRDLEDDFLSDNPKWKTLKLMEKYNKKDVELLEGIYLKMRPFMKNHPNISVMGDAEGCPTCGSHNREYRGYKYTATAIYRSIHCKSCNGWYRERTQDRDIQNRPEFVN